MLDEDIRFLLFVAAPVGLIVIPLYRAHRRARRRDREALRDAAPHTSDGA